MEARTGESPGSSGMSGDPRGRIVRPEKLVSQERGVLEEFLGGEDLGGLLFGAEGQHPVGIQEDVKASAQLFRLGGGSCGIAWGRW